MARMNALQGLTRVSQTLDSAAEAQATPERPTQRQPCRFRPGTI
jgi:hypothetical protein